MRSLMLAHVVCHEDFGQKMSEALQRSLWYRMVSFHGCFSIESLPFSAEVGKITPPCSLWFGLADVRTDYILTFQIFHEATSKDLRPC